MTTYTSSTDSRGFSLTINYTASGDTISGITFNLNSTNNNFSSWTCTSRLEILDSSGTVVSTLVTTNKQYTIAKNSSLGIVTQGRSFTATSSGNYKVRAYFDADTDASYVPNQTTATTGNIALTVGSPATQITAPTISGTGVSGTNITFAGGTYNNASSVTTELIYWYGTGYTQTSPAGSHASSPYTVTTADATSPVDIFQTRDTVVGTNGQSQYFYSASSITSSLAPTQTTYSITWDANGGSVSPTSSSVTAGSSVTTPTPTLSGANFTGWYDSTGGSTYNAGVSYTPSGSVTTLTLTAQWQYVVTWDSRGGTSVSPSNVNKGSSITTPTTTQSGYTFLGWFTSPTGGSSVGSSYTPTTSVTLYAQWQQVSTPNATMPSFSGNFSNGSISTPYTSSINVSDFTSISYSGLPPGLSLTYNTTYGTATLSGTPTTAGNYSVVITATNAPSGYTSVSTSPTTFNVSISSLPTATAPSISGSFTTPATTGTLYSSSLTILNYTSTSISTGSLPPGLTLNGNIISGTPTTTGTYTFKLLAVNDPNPSTYNQNTNSLSFTIIVNDPAATTPIFNSGSFGDGFINTFYSKTISVSNFTSASVTSGNIPAGLTLTYDAGANTVTISGTPTTIAPYTFVITAINSVSGYSQSNNYHTYSISIKDKIAPTPEFLDYVVSSARYGVPYNDGVLASPATSYVFTHVSGPTLSDLGLSFNTSNGLITGTPIATGTMVFSITAKNEISGFTSASATFENISLLVANSFLKVYNGTSFSYANAIRVYQNGVWVDAQVKIFKDGNWIYPS